MLVYTFIYYYEGFDITTIYILLFAISFFLSLNSILLVWIIYLLSKGYWVILPDDPSREDIPDDDYQPTLKVVGKDY